MYTSKNNCEITNQPFLHLSYMYPRTCPRLATVKSSTGLHIHRPIRSLTYMIYMFMLKRSLQLTISTHEYIHLWSSFPNPFQIIFSYCGWVGSCVRKREVTVISFRVCWLQELHLFVNFVPPSDHTATGFVFFFVCVHACVRVCVCVRYSHSAKQSVDRSSYRSIRSKAVTVLSAVCTQCGLDT